MQYRLQKIIAMLCLLLILASLSACGGKSNTTRQMAKPTVGPGQHLLEETGNLLKNAHTLHGIFDGSISGRLISGEMESEIWRMAPNQSRALILKSTLSQFTPGTLTVNDGKQLWQYDPTKKVVYTGQARIDASSISALPGIGQGDTQQVLFDILQTIFTGSTATLLSRTEQVNSRPVYVLHVVPRSQNGVAASFSYDGVVTLDQQTRLPLDVNLALTGIGQARITISSLTINQPLAASLFAFSPPPGNVPIIPFPNNTLQTSNSLTLQQAEQQAHYHLLSIPAAQTAYKLQSLAALGSPGNEIYTFTYLLANQSFTISESKALADLHLKGPMLSLRSSDATLTTHGSTSTLSWTDQGVGIQISGSLSRDQIVAVANLLV